MLSIFFDIAVELTHRSLINNVQAVTKGTQEVLVMGYDDEATFEVVEGDDQCVDGIEIQVICRLIEKKNVRLAPGNHGKGDARLLTSREQVHWSQGEVAGDTERSQMLPDFLRSLIRCYLGKLLDRRQFGIKHVLVMLSEHADPELAMNEPISRKVFDGANERLDERGLTHTVGSNQSDSRLHVNVDVYFSKQLCILIPANRALVESHNWRRNLLRIWEHEDASRIFHDLLDQFDSIDSLNSRLYERGPLGIVSELVNELLEMRDL